MTPVDECSWSCWWEADGFLSAEAGGGGSEASTAKTIKNWAYWELGFPFIDVWICYLEVEAFLEGDGSQDLGGDGAGQHVDLFHSSSVGVLLFPAVKHPPAQ